MRKSFRDIAPRRVALGSAILLLVAAPSSRAGWTSLETMPAPRRQGSAVVFQNAQGTVALSVVAPSIVRVRFAPGPSLGRDHSYAILQAPAGDPSAAVETGADSSVLRTGSLRVRVSYAPFRI